MVTIRSVDVFHSLMAFRMTAFRLMAFRSFAPSTTKLFCMTCSDARRTAAFKTIVALVDIPLELTGAPHRFVTQQFGQSCLIMGFDLSFDQGLKDLQGLQDLLTPYSMISLLSHFFREFSGVMLSVCVRLFEDYSGVILEVHWQNFDGKTIKNNKRCKKT